MRRPFKQPIDWTRYEACVRAAISVGCDQDQARDVALATLEEMAQRETPSPLSFARRRARWRGNDKLRSSNREVKGRTGYDVDNIPGSEPSPEQLLMLQQSLAALTPHQRATVALVMQGHSDAQIAYVFNISRSAVSHLRARIRDELLNNED